MISIFGFNLFNTIAAVFILWVSLWFYWNVAKMVFKSVKYVFGGSVLKFIFKKLDEPFKPLIPYERIRRLE